MPEYAGEQDPFWYPNSPEQCPSPSAASPPLGNDNCGIHQNSSVISHWFYLLTQGGKKNGIEVRPIPMEEAENILIRSIRYYLLPNSDFEDARMGSLVAAKDLYGECSQQVAQLENSWAAVGVGNPHNSECFSILGASELCINEPERQYLFEALGPEEANFRWEGIPENWFYRIQGERNQFLSIERLAEDPIPLRIMAIANWNGKVDTSELELIPSDCGQKAPRQPDPVPNFGEIRVFPNPAKNKTNLYLPDGLYPAELNIYDGSGRLMLSQQVNSAVSAYDLNGWNRGIYFVQVQSSKASWQNKLVIAE